MAEFENKVVLITGAGQGIGKATALQFATNGARVIATDINADALKSLEGIENISTKILDVTNKESINQLAKDLDKIDVLFNCAGYVHQGNIFECDESILDKSLDINVKSMYYMCHAFMPKMVAVGSGVVINMASICSSLRGAERRFAYGTTKGAVIGLTKSLAMDFVKHGIKVHCICPGTVDTPSFRGRVNEFQDPDKAYVDFVNRQKMKRLGSADEIAGAVLFLASKNAQYMTGTELVMDGGWSL